MKVSYKKLWVMLAEKEISKQKFREQLELSTGTMTKLNKGEEVSMNTLLRICEYFDCNFGEICDAVKIEEIEKNRRKCHERTCLPTAYVQGTSWKMYGMGYR